MSNTFRTEIVNITVYILNKSPTKSVLNRTPIEAWSGVKPVISHMKIFSCVCYAHVPTKNRSKFDNKMKDVFLQAMLMVQKGIECTI